MVELVKLFRKYYKENFEKYEKVEIKENLLNEEKEIRIKENNKIFLINIVASGKSRYNIFIENSKENSTVIVIFSKILDNSKLVLDINFKVSGELYLYVETINKTNSESDVNIKGYIEGCVVSISNMIIPNDSFNARINLNELFYINNGKIITIPSLLIYNNTGKGFHSSKKIKISEEEKFYLKSKGISEKDLSKMIEESIFIKAFYNNSL